MAYVVVHSENKQRLRKALDERNPLTLGRAFDSDLVIDDHRLSRHHCRFECNIEGHWMLIDLASTNGTIVNGERISAHTLRDNDEVQIGRTRIVFHEGKIPPPRPADPSESQAGMRAIDERNEGSNPSDTLLDSRVGVPGVKRPSPRPTTVQDASTRSGKNVPLAFQRPPAKPLVPSDRQSRFRALRWLRELFRTSQRPGNGET